VAELAAIEVTASVGQARAALDAATADRNNVHAGVRAEQIAALAAEIAKAKSRLEYIEQQLSRTATLARSDFASQQSLDQANNDVAAAQADVAGRKDTATTCTSAGLNGHNPALAFSGTRH
jgi:HlyD family secretion protein